LLLDKAERIIVAMAGRPPGHRFEEAVEEAVSALEDAAKICSGLKSIQEVRRGDFKRLSHGYSHGGGPLVRYFINYQLQDIWFFIFYI
jgi:hypothetical protein